MPKAEVGSTKYIANKMKSKGLQRLRWYCQVCGKQTRDENGFKQHTMSEGHVRAMQLVGEDPKKFINQYSNQFKQDFLQLLKTAHGEKKVHINHFYQEYIRDKEHVHMNATKWPSLTEFAKYLGKEGLCRVEETEKGLELAWIDDSPEAFRRREDVRKKERLAKGDEDTEARMLEAQMKRAREAAAHSEKVTEDQQPIPPQDVEAEPVKVSLKLGFKTAPKAATPPQETGLIDLSDLKAAEAEPTQDAATATDISDDAPAEPVAVPKMSLSLGAKSKGNALNRKNPLAKKRVFAPEAEERPVSNAERIMKEELERKKNADSRGFSKRPRLG